MGRIIDAKAAARARPLVRFEPGTILPRETAALVGTLDGLRRAAREAGRADALADVLDAAAETLADIERLRDAQLDGAEKEVLGLALRVAERIIHAEISLDPKVLTELVADARGAIGGNDTVRLYAGAKAHALLREELVLSGVELKEDPLEPAWSLRMETRSSVLSFGFEQQLRALRDALL